MTTAGVRSTFLSPIHIKMLGQRGISEEYARKAGLYTETHHDRAASLLNWKAGRAKRLVPCLVLPYQRPDGRNGYARIRPDTAPKIRGKAAKYLTPSGQHPELFYPPGVGADVLEDSGRELILTESELKAMAAAQEGFPSIGLTGVFGWKQKNRESLIPGFGDVEWEGRLAFLAYDSDIVDKPEVQDAEARLAARLAAIGACVKVIRIPHGPPDKEGKPTKNGLDDYLASQPNRKKAMRELMDAAEDPPPIDPASLKADAKEIDPAVEAQKILDATAIEGVCRLISWRGELHTWRAGAYSPVPLSDVHACTFNSLDENYSKLSRSVVGNVVDALRAKAHLSHHIEPPEWLGEPPIDWPPSEVLSAKNGLVHIPSFLAGGKEHHLPPTPRFFTQNSLDFDFLPAPPVPSAWLAFLSQLWPDDTESIATLQEWVGYCLVRDTRQQKIFMLVGPRRSGKGTICRIVRAVVGIKNVVGPTLASLGQNFGLQPLLGKSLAIISDARLGGRTDTQVVVERLLSISGEDAITIDRKFQDPVTCKLPTRLMIVSNELPRMGDSSGALTGRMILLRLTESFFDREDPDLTSRLLDELPGILLWAIQGWVRLQKRRRFSQPKTATEMLEELADLSSPVGAYVRECCDVGPMYEVTRGVLYNAYCEWAQRQGRQHVEDSTAFGRSLRAAVSSIRDAQRRDLGVPVRLYVGIQPR